MQTFLINPENFQESAGHKFLPFMLTAIALSQQAFGDTYPNPCVGALLILNGQIVAEGWHKKAGAEHAELMAIKAAQEKNIDLSRCSLVVTLEPCNHQGKTPPCSKAILEAGIKHVLIGALDPNSKASGGAEYLKANGVEVETGLAEQACLDNIADFICWQNKKRPYSILKLASTLDGRIATRNKHSQWISSAESLMEVHKLRSKMQAILIGGNTLYTDNPLLTCRLPDYLSNSSHDQSSKLSANLPSSLVANPQVTQPLAVIVTSRLQSNIEELQLFKSRATEVIIFTTVTVAASQKAKQLRLLGIKIYPLDFSQGEFSGAKNSKLNLRQAFEILFAEHNVHNLMCEGGGLLALSLQEANLVDEFRLHMSSKIIADAEAIPLFTGREPVKISDSLVLRFDSVRFCGADLHLRLRRVLSEN